MNDSTVLAAGIRRLTVNLDSDDVALFEGTWPVPHGVALHSYLLQGDRVVLIDPWDDGGYGTEELEVDLAELGLSWKHVDAVAFTGPPHPGQADRLRAARPGLELWDLPTPGADHRLGALSLVERGGFWTVPEAGVVFTGEVFAGLGWVDEEGWAEDLPEDTSRWFEDEALRWFSARPRVPAALPDRAKILAPAHGLLWGKNPAVALERAQRFDDWGRGPALDEVAIVWPAGPDRDAETDALVGGILDAGWGLNLFRVPGDDPTAVAAGVRRSSLAVVAPGIETGFLRGLEKPVWKPEGVTPAALRTGVVQRIRELV